jgi:hypothetical protein
VLSAIEYIFFESSTCENMPSNLAASARTDIHFTPYLLLSAEGPPRLG